MKDIESKLKAEVHEFFGLLLAQTKLNGAPPALIMLVTNGDLLIPTNYTFVGSVMYTNGGMFDDIGSMDLNSYFKIGIGENDDDDWLFDCLEKAGNAVIEILKEIPTTQQFKDLPNPPPIVFVLSVQERIMHTLGSLHPDGSFESYRKWMLPPDMQ